MKNILLLLLCSMLAPILTFADNHAEEETAASAESGAADNSATGVEIPSADSTVADSSGASDAQIPADAPDPQASNDADS